MLKFVICGLEHSGTTLLSELFRQAPGIYSGFECGVLLCPSPKEFEGFDPFFTNMLGADGTGEGWELTRAELVEACHSATYDDFYSKVQEFSNLIPSTTSDIFDKTPRYLSCLGDCLNRTDVPFIASFKDPRSKVFSDFTRTFADFTTRADKSSHNFDSWYSAYVELGGRYLKTCYEAYQNTRARSEDRVAFVSLESLCMDVRVTCERVFEHVGLEFNTQYLLLPNQDSISARVPFEYKKRLTKAQQQRIMDDFAECSDWFYE